MKKLLLSVNALLLSMACASAQGWETAGAHDDFATATVYKNGPSSQGLIWFADGVFSISRPGTGAMTITATSAGGAGNYPLFGVNFNDSNDDGSGTPFTVDLSSGMADVTVDIENTSSQLLFIDVKLVDASDVQSAIEPNVSDVLVGSTWGETPYKRKALNGFTVAAGARKTVTIDLSSVPANLGGLTAGSYANCGTGPYYCPVTSHDINPAAIKAVLFRVNFGSDNIDLSEGDDDHTVDTPIAGGSITAFTGNIVLHDFKIGTTTAGLSGAEMIEKSISVFPNPAAEALNVSFETTTGANVTLTDIVGNPVYSTTAQIGDNKLTVNTSDFPSGVYLLNIVTENGTVARKVNIQ